MPGVLPVIASGLVLLAAAFLGAGAGISGQAASACQAQPPASTAISLVMGCPPGPQYRLHGLPFPCPRTAQTAMQRKRCNNAGIQGDPPRPHFAQREWCDRTSVSGERKGTFRDAELNAGSARGMSWFLHDSQGRRQMHQSWLPLSDRKSPSHHDGLAPAFLAAANADSSLYRPDGKARGRFRRERTTYSFSTTPR